MSGEWLRICSASACPEVRRSGNFVDMRDSTEERVVLSLTRREWEALITKARDGELDWDALP